MQDDFDEKLGELKIILRKVADDLELASLSAKLAKHWVDALMKQNFRREEALQILCANPQLIKFT